MGWQPPESKGRGQVGPSLPGMAFAMRPVGTTRWPRQGPLGSPNPQVLAATVNPVSEPHFTPRRAGPAAVGGAPEASRSRARRRLCHHNSN